MENLLLAWEQFLRGKKDKKDVREFQAELSQNLDSLYYDLQNQTYVHDIYSAFNISDPKPRQIHKASVRDRVVHRLIYQALYPYFHKRFIYDSYSCRLDKGTHRAVARFAHFARQVSGNHTKTCYVLKCDIKKFFASIDHEILLKVLRRHILDQDLLWLIKQIISSFSSTHSRVGLPLGNLTSQLLVNIYLHEFDMFVKQELRIKYYIRYADDFVILARERQILQETLSRISEFLSGELKLSLHEKKVFIKTYSSGVDFLGWVNFPHHRQLRTSTKRKIIKNLKHYPRPETVNSYRGLLSHGNTQELQQKLTSYLSASNSPASQGAG